jgi:Tol biopolymer transport system component
MKLHRTALCILLALGVFIAACGSAANPTAPEAEPPQTTALTPAANQDITLSGSGGGVIAFTGISASSQRSSRIYVMNADSSGLQALPNSGGSGSGWAPAWSPDGNWIAYIVHQSDSNWPLYVIGADGSDRQLLLNGDLCHFPSWSPDGAHISFTRNGSIWVGTIAFDGTTVTLGDLRQLTSMDRQDASVSSWSPDGTRIVFASQMGDPLGTSSYYDPNSGEIYLINSDGTGLKRVTYNTVFDSFPMFSPDGGKLVFASNRNPAKPRATDIFIADWVD